MAFSFGAPQPAQPAAGGGLFGAKPAGTTSTFTGFGAAPAQGSTSTPAATSGGLFGAKPAGGGLFGAAQPQGQQQPSTGGLFGAQQQQPPTGGLFGGQQQQQQQPATGGLFGQQQQQPAAGGLFGAKPAAPATGGLFGSTAQPQASGGLFGSTAQPQQQQTGGFFGSQTQPQQQGGGLFGSQAKPAGGLFSSQPQTGGLFSSTTTQPQTGIFASQSQPQTQQQSTLLQSTSQSAPEADIGARMEAVKNAWEPTSVDCRFKYFFYNLVEPGTAHLYGRPANATDDRAWEKARRENPDPSRYVPALAVGFEDLQKRIEAQAKQEAAHKAKIEELTAALNALTRQTTLQTSLRAQEISHRLTTLSHRLLSVLVNSPLLIPTLRSTPIRREEEQLHEQLEALSQDLDGPGGMGRVKGRVNELWAVVGALRARRERGGKREGWGMEDSALEELAGILAKQQQALQLLTTLCQTNLDDAQVISKNLGLVSSPPS